MIGNVIMINEAGVEKNASEDYGLIIKSKTINPPQGQFHRVEVPGRNGSYDISEVLTGGMRYNDRNIDLEFRFLGPERDRSSLLTFLNQFVYAQKLKFIFNDDDNFYYLGRMTDYKSKVVDDVALDIESEIVAEPYKRYVFSSAEDWLWDPFDFELGLANEAKDLVVDGTLTVVLAGSDSEFADSPIITVDNPMVVSYDGGNPINLTVGSRTIYDIIILKGIHTFTFTGNGTVTIDYRGGML